MPPTPEAHMAAVIAKLTTQTGRSLEDWVELLRSAGLPKFKEQVDWLKQVHGVGHVAAQVIAWEAAKGPDYVEPTPEDWLAKQYAGPKPAWCRSMTGWQTWPGGWGTT
ncbi:MAG TPA: DUF4287 domain-containing protein [Symbiobacteriaceae bacterium]